MEDFDFGGDDTVFHEAEFFCRADANVNDAPFDEGATVVNPDDFRAVVVEICDAHHGAHGKGLVSGSCGVV